MAYILKNTSGLLNTRFTDVGRAKLAKGKLDIRYFQVGDSEIAYNAISGYNLTNNYIIEAAYNAQNSTQEPESNKMHVKYPIYVTTQSGGTYGLVSEDMQVYPVYNTAAMRGFFTGSQYSWSAITMSAYTKTANYVIDTCQCDGSSIVLSASTCSATTGTPEVGDFITIYFDGVGSCGNLTGNYPILTYKIQSVNGNTIGLDRDLPNLLSAQCCGSARVFIYPSGMTELYDTNTPQGYWPPDVINFESVCDLANTDVKIWNMNIPWSVSPAGIVPSLNEDYTKYASAPYLGSKEFFGYNETSGQTFWVNSTATTETTDTYYYNSYDEIIKVYPNEQKAIAIVHYTNNAIDSYYGEKFALKSYDADAVDNIGDARNFKVSIPWLMWHKSNTGNMGEVFYIDPNVGEANYFQLKYMKSSVNSDMNDPGLRYYHLWDTHLNDDGHPSRVGKVFPDIKTIVFDDEEIVAALSYKSNRNWTLTTPSLSLLTPNLFDNIDDDYGVLGNDEEYMYVTYRFNSTGLTNSLHCNYYSKIKGPSLDCGLLRQDVAVRFGNEFPFMSSDCCCFQGYNVNGVELLAQLVSGATTQPNPASWKVIDVTNQLSGYTVNGCIPASAVTATTFVISYNQYNDASYYNLADYISIPLPVGEEDKLNFGDEYYFYGNIETDIQASIYEMRFLCNLASTQFNLSSNPTCLATNRVYITEIGLFDVDKDLVVITKLQSPILRQGTQQFVVKMDF